jgi:hypothetical protein
VQVGQVLVYERFSAPDEGKYDALMMSPENARALGNGSDVAPFVVANPRRRFGGRTCSY